MPTIDVTDIVLDEEAKELDVAYSSNPKVRAAIDQFDSECRLRRELIKARKKNKLTQKQIHESTGLTQQVISRIESNTSVSPSLKNLMIYADALGYEITFRPKKPTHKKPENTSVNR